MEVGAARFKWVREYLYLNCNFISLQEILDKAPAALKLAEVTEVIKQVEEDGGEKGVNEITNFRALLQEIHRLPQYSLLLEELTKWKNGKKDMQEVMLWMQQAMAAKKISPDWISEAISNTHGPESELHSIHHATHSGHHRRHHP
jgi:hypothetical protein